MTIQQAQEKYLRAVADAYQAMISDLTEAMKPIPKQTAPNGNYPSGTVGEGGPELVRLPDGQWVISQRVEFPHNFGKPKPTGEIKGNE